MEIRIEDFGGSGRSQRTFSRSSIDHLEFSPETTPPEPVSVANAEDWWEAWRRTRPYLGLPRSPAGEIGLGLARHCMVGGDPGRAKALCEQIVEADWNASRRSQAMGLGLEARWAAGDRDTAEADARSIVAELQASPGVLLSARAVLGRGAFLDLRQLQADHPRWEEDDRVRPIRARLVREALDHFLFAVVFHGDREGAAAEGMRAAAEVYAFVGDAVRASEFLELLEAIYPPAFAGRRPSPVPASSREVGDARRPESFPKINQ